MLDSTYLDSGLIFWELRFRPRLYPAQKKENTDYKDILDLIWGIEMPAPWICLLSILGSHS